MAKKIPSLVIPVAISLLMFAGIGWADPQVRWIDVSELEEVIAAHAPVIIDLRTPAEYRDGHIPGAIHVPIEMLVRDPAALDSYRTFTLLLYCRTINKTNAAVSLIGPRGFKTIFALKGGYEAYRRNESDHDAGHEGSVSCRPHDRDHGCV